MSTVIICIIFAAYSVGVYFLGYSDGKTAEQENHMFEKLDSLIARVKPEQGGDKRTFDTVRLAICAAITKTASVRSASCANMKSQQFVKIAGIVHTMGLVAWNQIAVIVGSENPG